MLAEWLANIQAEVCAIRHLEIKEFFFSIKFLAMSNPQFGLMPLDRNFKLLKSPTESTGLQGISAVRLAVSLWLPYVF